MNKELTFPAERIAPLPYEYDSENPLQKAILQRVADYCGYTIYDEEAAPDGVQPAQLWQRIWLSIRFLSLLTCWTDGTDDTLITQTRKQSFTAHDICGCKDKCSCTEDAIIIPLEYAPRPIQPWVEGTISVVINGKPDTVKIDAKYLHEHTDPATDRLYIMREDFPNILYRYGRCCFTNRELAIILQYNAGYDAVPEGLLAAICPIMAKIDAAKISLNDCAAAMTQVVGLLRRKKVGNIEYEWSDSDAGTQRTEVLFTDIFDISILAEIESISRCDQATGVEEMGDVV